ncbi:MAG: hypothetical protein JWL75_249 [Parcubacteria group bacterium]|nr:hypothetical protein [Parcubacteria group bacterium]
MKEGFSLNSGPLRSNKEAVEYHTSENLQRFYENPQEVVTAMFGGYRLESGSEGVSGNYRGLRIEDLTSEEFADIDNYIQYAAKRLAAGAASSKVFHEQVARGRLSKALDTFNPDWALGHDSIHSMFTYAESNGASLVPAYMKVDAIITSSGLSMDSKANLEELYVTAFTIPDVVLKPICEKLIQEGLSGEELAEAVIDRWGVQVAQDLKHNGIQVLTPEYIKENMLQEFVTMVRNYCQQVESGIPNAKFSLNEFRRILRPLLNRLEQKDSLDVPVAPKA